ncbi:MAG: zinc ribbon domain-containing protein [Thermoplasmata archaeon]|nr:MAG: zinc ribbon domain-containing protein [Thermoplasmata archaeon]
MPEDQEKGGICPICDAKVDIDTKRCPECKADLTVFGVKTGDEEPQDVKIPEYEESLERLLGEIGEKNGKKEHELFEEIMAAVDKTSMPSEEGAVEPAPKEDLAAPPAEAAEAGEVAPEGAIMFECPLCNTLVEEDAKACPGCGAIFAGGEEEAAATAEGGDYGQAEPKTEFTTQYEEPAPPAEETQVFEETPMVEEASALPPETMPEAPEQEIVEEKPAIEEIPPPKEKRRFGLGLRRAPEEAVEAEPPPPPEKDEKTLRKELSMCVAEVKPLLATARKVGINVSEGRKLIDQAIGAGKKKDFKTAITLVRDSQKIIENVINQTVLDSIQSSQLQLNAISKAGGDVKELENMLAKVQVQLNERKYTEAVELAKKVALDAEESIKKLKTEITEKEATEIGADVSEKLRSLIELIKSGEEVKVNVKGARTLLTEARVAINKNELDQAENLLTKAREDFLRELPKQLTDIISNSKPVLYKAKMQGVDIRPSIKLLKEASTALKLNNYLDALEAIKRYNTAMTQYME